MRLVKGLPSTAARIFIGGLLGMRPAAAAVTGPAAPRARPRECDSAVRLGT
jgi:hypothetical protein